MMHAIVAIAVMYGIIGFFVLVAHADNESFMKAAARGIFWVPLLVVGTCKEFWKLLKE